MDNNYELLRFKEVFLVVFLQCKVGQNNRDDAFFGDITVFSLLLWARRMPSVWALQEVDVHVRVLRPFAIEL